MGEKKQFRSEQARKNYEKQERLRARAARRKAFRAQKAKVTAQGAAWLKQNKKQTIIVAAAALAVILVLWLGCKWFFGPGGSLPNFFGHVRGVEDSWVVTDLNPRSNQNSGSSNVNNAPRSKTPRYFHLEPLEGFTQDVGFTFNPDEINQDQHYTANEKTGLVESVYVFGIPNKTAEKHASDMVSVMNMSDLSSEVMTQQIAGHDTRYVYFVYDQDPDINGVVTEAYASLCLCIDTTEDACLLVAINSYVVPKEEVPAVEALVAESEKVLKNLTVY